MKNGMLANAGSKFKQNRALMPQPEPCLDIPEDEDLVDMKPVAAKLPKVFIKICCGLFLLGLQD